MTYVAPLAVISLTSVCGTPHDSNRCLTDCSAWNASAKAPRGFPEGSSSLNEPKKWKLAVLWGISLYEQLMSQYYDPTGF
jgi:hypothetical protein